MSSVVVRRIIATPGRPASEAWAKIVDLIAPSSGEARTELLSVAGISSSLISDEALKDAPAVLRGKGPRVRFYCIYDEEAVSGDKASEAALATVPTEDTWKLSLPCLAEDLEWVSAALKSKSTRITARNVDEQVVDEEDTSTSSSAQSPTINREAFLRP